MIRDNVFQVKENIAHAARRAGRNPNDITLVSVTKNAAVDAIKEAIDAGITDIGENRVQDAIIKYNAIRYTQYERRVKWHLIGHLQTNKAKDAVKIFDIIHSIDSVRLAEAVNKAAEKIDKIQDILIEVNVSGEESKFGIAPENISRLIFEAANFKNIKICGLMTMAPFADDAEKSRPYFRELREFRDKVNWRAGAPVLSMGMSQDYEVAIEEGSNMVRIGRAIFGP